jgi:hypothetical protein
VVATVQRKAITLEMVVLAVALEQIVHQSKLGQLEPLIKVTVVETIAYLLLTHQVVVVVQVRLVVILAVQVALVFLCQLLEQQSLMLLAALVLIFQLVGQELLEQQTEVTAVVLRLLAVRALLFLDILIAKLLQ